MPSTISSRVSSERAGPARRVTAGVVGPLGGLGRLEVLDDQPRPLDLGVEPGSSAIGVAQYRRGIPGSRLGTFAGVADLQATIEELFERRAELTPADGDAKAAVD